MIWATAVSFENARIVTDEGVADRLRFSSRILSIGERPRPSDLVVDLEGAVVLPGLVNAHDHLELNHYGRQSSRDRYANASGWIADMGLRLGSDPAILAGRAHPLTDRLFIGALKNLLAGTTTVAHHNPFYPEMRRTLPIRVVKRYGWAHSFALQERAAGARGEPGGDVGSRWRVTPADATFFVHLAEGVDPEAGAELARLDMAGALASNTAIVHGVAIDEAGWRLVARRGAGLVWCPASNLFLFGRTAAVRQALDGDARVRVAIGTDSRLTGSRDLLDELRTARAAARVSSRELLAMATGQAAALLRQPRAGRIAVDHPADLVVIPPRASDPADALLATARRDVRMVLVEGRPLIGDPDLAPVFRARYVVPRPLRVDAAPKIADAALVRRIAGCPITEPGVVVA